MTTLRQEAREAYAKGLEAQGPEWTNTANSVRAGYTNVWIAAGIATAEALLRLIPDEADPEEGGRP